MTDVSVDLFVSSVNKLADQLDANRKVVQGSQREIEEAKKADIRARALQQALEAMFGVSVVNLEEVDSGVHMTLVILDVKALFVLNSVNELSSIQILTPEYSWIDCVKILEECAAVKAPNDLRQAICLISSLQQSAQ